LLGSGFCAFASAGSICAIHIPGWLGGLAEFSDCGSQELPAAGDALATSVPSPVGDPKAVNKASKSASADSLTPGLAAVEITPLGTDIEADATGVLMRTPRSSPEPLASLGPAARSRPLSRRYLTSNPEKAGSTLVEPHALAPYIRRSTRHELPGLGKAYRAHAGNCRYRTDLAAKFSWHCPCK
jgi:hypothetical protein